jgi:phosphate/sulfate permease
MVVAMCNNNQSLFFIISTYYYILNNKFILKLKLMNIFYSVSLFILVVLAIFDLVIGVSNDAVNFLNSAIGCKVSSKKVIMIIASIGIIAGAISSGEMMNIAKKGIFNPTYFSYTEITCIFISVMITDIILVDLFNTIGLPISTTVSIIFALLGSSLNISIIKLLISKKKIINILNYMKFNNIINIILGIFLSVIISFFFSAIIHYIIRYIFTFNYKKKNKYIYILWSSISLTSMTYFLIIKNFNKYLIKIPQNTLLYFITNNNSYIYIIFIILLFISWIIYKLQYNLFKIIILYGTFCLAMAFANNDLVNFIGIPIAGIQSFKIWHTSKYTDPNKLIMSELSNTIKINPIILLSAGGIMILTLWLSRKTKRITETELKITQNNNDNIIKNSSNVLARIIVKIFLEINKIFNFYMPKIVLHTIEKKFKKQQNNNEAAFDLVRASANLTISSILISIASYNNLPLSTTFVTFMVSMGTSLSDRAWNRETAVYKVTEMLKVIRGWFLTGIISFIISGMFVTLLLFLKMKGLIISILLTIVVLYQNNKTHHKILIKEQENKKNIINITDDLNKVNILPLTYLIKLKKLYQNTIIGLIKENTNILKKNIKKCHEIKHKTNYIKNIIILSIKQNKYNNVIIINNILYIYDSIEEILHYIEEINISNNSYIINSYTLLKNIQKKKITSFQILISKYFYLILKTLKNKQIHHNYNYDITIYSIKNNIINHINDIMNQNIGIKNNELILKIFLKSQHIIKLLHNILIYCQNIKIIQNKINNDNKRY